ncbi:Cell adhesion molecule 2-like 4 [Homarus americanus]|uniref:Cell adhesion molecule 2-like 4 n=1 Tax=Homarus americanus TaxID=6706 RepID=A0A8J5KG16_HOMAM|nr:Cell adhesion molecule 2-like 4 [Homarus americanus]
MVVVTDTPESDPHISGTRNKYHAGDVVQVNCTSSPSKPAAALMWYVNDDQADSAFLVDYAPVPNGEGLETSILGLHFRARPSHLRQGRLKLRCTATIAAVYFRENTIYARAHLTPRRDPLESQGMLTGVSAGVLDVQVWVVLMGVALVLLR